MFEPVLSSPTRRSRRPALAIAIVAGALPALAGGQRCLEPAPDPQGTPKLVEVASPLPADEAQRPVVQLAILLDTSGSMQGLIDQAKGQLWAIVNEFALAKRQGQAPRLQVALYEYGKQSIPESEGYLRQILPLTDDLDEVSSQLFALSTNGGEEYCGRVIDAAAKGLAWSDRKGDLKIIVVAGNEPFTQGQVDYRTSIPGAVKKGIIINTIHCGDRATGERTGWKDGAILGEGTFSCIETNAQAPHIDAPQDAEILRLGTEVNATYLGFGAQGDAARERQELQDANAVAAAPGSSVQRAVTKSSGLYSNSSWDLVDALKDGKVKLEDVKEADLPQELKGLTLEQRKAKVEDLRTRRGEIQARIAELNKQRADFVAQKLKDAGQDAGNSLQAALVQSIRAQASKLGYVFADPAPAQPPKDQPADPAKDQAKPK